MGRDSQPLFAGIRPWKKVPLAPRCHIRGGEDQSRIRKGHADANFGILRCAALSLLKNNKTEKIGVKGKRLIAAGSEAHFEEVLFAA